MLEWGDLDEDKDNGGLPYEFTEQPVRLKDEETLHQIIVLAHELLYGTASWLRTARFPEAARNKFREAIENALAEHALQNGKLDQAAARLREAGDAFLKEARLSNKRIDEKRNLLEFSVHRRELIQLVWLAQTAQLIDPELYTDGAKTSAQGSNR